MKTFQQKSLLVRFSSGIGFSCRKRDKKVTKEVARSKDTDEDAVDVFKRLLPKGALDTWQTAIEAARAAHDEMTLPWRDDGYRLLRSDKYLDYIAAMRKHKALVEAEKEKFVDAYPGYCAAAPQRLQQLYDAKDFPDVEKLVRRFKFKTDVMAVPDGDDFRVDLAADEVAEIRWQIDTETRANTLRPLAEPIKRMLERLSDPDHTFRNTLVTNITDIIKLVPEGDPAIDALIERIRELVRHDPQLLRESPSTRRATAEKASEILATMSGYFSAEAGSPVGPLELSEDNSLLLKRDDASAIAEPLISPAQKAPPKDAPSTRTLLPTWRRAILPRLASRR